MSAPDINPELPNQPDTIGVDWKPGNYNELELYKSLVEESPVAAGLYYSRNLYVAIANNVILNIWGKDKSVIGMPLAEAVPELEGQPFLAILDSIFESGKTLNFTEMPATLPMGGIMGTYYFDFTYKPMFDENGNVYAILNKAVDVTERVMAKRRHEASEKRFRLITEQSPMAIGLLKGRDMIIELGNDKIFELWGKSSSITGLPLAEALPELKGQPFLQILDNVFTSGETFYGYDVLAKLNYNGKLKEVYFDFTYTPVRNAEGNTDGVMVLANEVTERIISTRKLAESEAKFRTVMDVAPAAMAVFMGRELRIEMPNQAFKDVIGKGSDIEGKTLGELLPELESQAFLKILDDVFTSGQPYQMYGAPVTFLREEGPEIEYFNIIFTPLFDENNDVYAILDISVKVTDAIHNQQAIAEAEASLRGAIELAELATWSLNPVTGIVSYSERLQQWFGFDTASEIPENVFRAVHPADRTRIEKAIQKALDTDGDGIYDEEYTVINLKTGRERILHAQAKAFLDAEGKPYLLAGTAQDITNQRKIQTALEHEVAERTMQLELANKGLEEANRQLLTSNEELAQYAYVASHDLQEPLRKITMFSNLLHERDVDNVHTALIDKIVNASKRMSSLIKDLLEFSRLLNTDARFTETDITSVVKAIRDDFELLIEEKQAVIEVNNLPVLEAVPLQMNQLFYNLISNALKFIPHGRKPVVKITCDIALPQLVNMHINSPQNIQYYLLSVHDNGIGIDEKYSKQIFDVFKRLHGRDEYSGSGIGLAICRRIVINHNGAIYVESVPGEGTIFRIILPKKQQN
jgi:PAS domain S-box-containing protein